MITKEVYCIVDITLHEVTLHAKTEGKPCLSLFIETESEGLDLVIGDQFEVSISQKASASTSQVSGCMAMSPDGEIRKRQYYALAEENQIKSIKMEMVVADEYCKHARGELYYPRTNGPESWNDCVNVHKKAAACYRRAAACCRRAAKDVDGQ